MDLHLCIVYVLIILCLQKGDMQIFRYYRETMSYGTVCIARMNIFKRKTQLLLPPKSNLWSAPGGKYPVTIPKQVLYGFRFVITEKALVKILNIHLQLQ